MSLSRDTFNANPKDFETGMAQMYEALFTHGSVEQRSKFNWCMFHLTEYFTSWYIGNDSYLYVRLINQLRDWRVVPAERSNPGIIDPFPIAMSLYMTNKPNNGGPGSYSAYSRPVSGKRWKGRSPSDDRRPAGLV